MTFMGLYMFIKLISFSSTSKLQFMSHSPSIQALMMTFILWNGFLHSVGIAHAEEKTSPDPLTEWKPKSGTHNPEVWKRSGHTEIDPSHPYTLEELITLAFANSPTTRAAWQQARQAAASLGISQSQYFPTLTGSIEVSGNYSYDDTDTQTTDPLRTSSNLKTESSPNSPTVTPGISFSYLLWDFGARDADVEASRQSLISSNFSFNRSLQQLAADVQTRYFEYDEAVTQLQSALTSLDSARSNYDATQIKVEHSLATVTDMLSARERLSQAVFQAEQARVSVATSRSSLLQTLGLSANTPITIAPVPDDFLTPEVTATVERLIEQAMTSRPDLAAKYALIKSKEASLSKARRDFLPTANIDVSYSRAFSDTETDYTPASLTTPDSDADGYTDSLSAGITFSVDLFDGLSKINTKRSSEAALKQARLELLSAELEAIGEVWSNYFKYRSAQKQVAYGREQVSAATAAYKATRIEYENDLKSSLDLITAEEKLASARSGLASARTQLLVSSANLSLATGRSPLSASSPVTRPSTEPIGPPAPQLNSP